MAWLKVVNTVLVAAVVLQRLLELRLSSRNRKELIAAGARAVPDPVFPWMVVTHVLLLGGSALEPWLLDRPFLALVGIPALVLFLAAQGLRVWVLRTLGARWNVRVMRSSDGVVSDGPYRWIRHPNYLAVIVEGATLPLFHGAWWTWLAVQCLHVPVLAIRIRVEESQLRSIPEYRREMEGKPRFLPFAPRRHGTAPTPRKGEE